jgi:hypothetical protein
MLRQRVATESPFQDHIGLGLRDTHGVLYPEQNTLFR